MALAGLHFLLEIEIFLLELFPEALDFLQSLAKTLLMVTPFGDVKGCAFHPRGLAVAVQEAETEDIEPATEAIGMHNPVFLAELAATAQGVPYRIVHPGPVLRGCRKTHH
jgi:hypothetical protein